MLQFLWLIPLGFLVGTFGTLIGAGGGFILVPVLLLVYPDKNPETITSISLAVVFFNALSGSSAYAKMKRIDYKSGIWFAIATIPGSILGAITTSFIPRHLFNGIFGVLLVAASIFLMITNKNEEHGTLKSGKNYITRTLIDQEGIQYVFSYNPVVGVILSVFVGYLSSLLGIGGGIIHVPALVHLLNYPVHIATATSHFILAIMALSGSVVHLIDGSLAQGAIQTVALAIGVLFGAQLGAKLSRRIHGKMIIKSLGAALGIVGVRIFLMAFPGKVFSLNADPIHPILFPGLGLQLKINPVAFDFFGVDVYWSGIIIAFGCLLSIFLALKHTKYYEIDQRKLLNLVLVAAPVAFVGARISHVVFHWPDYSKQFIEILKVWHGGFNFYGAMIAVFITVLLYCRKNQLNIWDYSDFLIPYLVLSQAIGVWGNLFNQKVVGAATSLPWRMEVFDSVKLLYINEHPVFFYQSLFWFGVFMFLMWFRKKKKFQNEVVLLYISLCGLSSFSIDWLRLANEFSGFLLSFQIASGLCFLISLSIFFIRRREKLWRKGTYKTGVTVKYDE